MAIKKKTRMYEPWGYQEQNNYQGAEIIHENDLDSFFADTKYVRDDNKIHFYNKDGEELVTLDVNEFIKSDSIIEKTEYKDGILKIYFTNGDVVTIDLTELLDENEFKDGLIVDGHVVKVLIDSTGDPYLTVSENGVKLFGVKDEIERLDERVDDEIERATDEEERIEARLDQEIQDRIDDVDKEKDRAISVETALDAKINTEKTRATQTEQALDNKINTLNAEIDSEERRAEAAEQEIRTNLTTEISNRISAVNVEKLRAEAVEQALQDAIYAEEIRASEAEETLSDRIDEIISGSPIEKLDELIEKLGYKDNDTLNTTNEHEVAFGEWNVSETDTEPSGQTIFSIGIGTSAHDRKNALEVRKDGSVYMWVEGGYVQINNLLAQLTNEVYDNDSSNP